MGFEALATTILTFAAIVGIGAVLRASGRVRVEHAAALNAVIVYVGLPAFILRAIHGAALGTDLIGVVGVAWLVIMVACAAAMLAARLLRLDRARTGAFVLAAALGNTGYIGYPLTQRLLGQDAVSLAVFADVFGTVIALVVVGLPLASRFGPVHKGRVGVFRELATFPAIVALVVGLGLRAVSFPGPVSDGLDLLANMVAPLIMLSVGLTVRPRSIVHGAPTLAVLALIRLALAPLVAVLVGGWLLHGDAYRVSVLEASVPSMMLTLAVSERFGLDSDFVAAAIFVTTLVSAATIPLWQALVA